MNHQKNSESFLDDAECSFGEGSMGAGNQYVALAQTHAILAVAEQLRVGNLIALGDAEYKSNAAIFDEDQELNWPLGILAAQIAEALGIEQQ